MMTRKLNFVFALTIAWASVSADAFELITHGVMTNRAYAASALGAQPDTLKRLGLVDLAAPFGTNYYDFTSFSISKRSANPYESSKMLDAQTDQLRVRTEEQGQVLPFAIHPANK